MLCCHRGFYCLPFNQVTNHMWPPRKRWLRYVFPSLVPSISRLFHFIPIFPLLRIIYTSATIFHSHSGSVCCAFFYTYINTEIFIGKHFYGALCTFEKTIKILPHPEALDKSADYETNTDTQTTAIVGSLLFEATSWIDNKNAFFLYIIRNSMDFFHCVLCVYNVL